MSAAADKKYEITTVQLTLKSALSIQVGPITYTTRYLWAVPEFTRWLRGPIIDVHEKYRFETVTVHVMEILNKKEERVEVNPAVTVSIKRSLIDGIQILSLEDTRAGLVDGYGLPESVICS